MRRDHESRDIKSACEAGCSVPVASHETSLTSCQEVMVSHINDCRVVGRTSV